jgi:hypothetical protein
VRGRDGFDETVHLGVVHLLLEPEDRQVVGVVVGGPAADGV